MDEKNVETWLPIPGYEGRYSVSDRGNVRTHRAGPHSNETRLLTPRATRHGPTVRLDGTTYSTARLVWLTFGHAKKCSDTPLSQKT